MRIGKLNKRMKILKYTEISPDEGFGPKCAYVPYKTIWAEMLKPRIMPSVIQGDGQSVVITQGFNIRPIPINKGDKVEVAGHVYDVLDVDMADPACYILTTIGVRA